MYSCSLNCSVIWSRKNCILCIVCITFHLISKWKHHNISIQFLKVKKFLWHFFRLTHFLVLFEDPKAPKLKLRQLLTDTYCNSFWLVCTLNSCFKYHTVCFTYLGKLNLKIVVQFKLELIFATAVSKNEACFKSGQNQLIIIGLLTTI